LPVSAYVAQNLQEPSSGKIFLGRDFSRRKAGNNSGKADVATNFTIRVSVHDSIAASGRAFAIAASGPAAGSNCPS
jgi:hypothetical protein